MQIKMVGMKAPTKEQILEENPEKYRPEIDLRRREAIFMNHKNYDMFHTLYIDWVKATYVGEQIVHGQMPALMPGLEVDLTKRIPQKQKTPVRSSDEQLQRKPGIVLQSPQGNQGFNSMSSPIETVDLSGVRMADEQEEADRDFEMGAGQRGFDQTPATTRPPLREHLTPDGGPLGKDPLQEEVRASWIKSNQNVQSRNIFEGNITWSFILAITLFLLILWALITRRRQ